MIDTRVIGATLIIAGTSIGAGMLALPASTASYGFFPTLLLFIVMCACYMFTGLMTLEANLWFKPGTNLISMSQKTLGFSGQVIAWITYLVLMYGIIVAYLSALAGMSSETSQALWQFSLPHWLNNVVTVGIVGIIIILGARQVDWFNRLLTLGLVGSFVALLIFAVPEIGNNSITYTSFVDYTKAIPIIATSFGYQLVVPGLRVYLNSNAKKLRIAIIGGSLITLAIYVLWELIIFSSLPMEGKYGLLSLNQGGGGPVELAQALSHVLENGLVGLGFKWFAFFAIMTSLLGVGYGLFDFFKDGLKLSVTAKGTATAFIVTFAPPFVISITFPDIFNTTLQYVGVSVAILFALLPTLMVWSGRHYKNIASGYRAMGGKLFMLYAIILAVAVIIAQIYYA